MLGKLFEADDVVCREEVVHVSQRGLHSARERLVLRGAEQRVEPDQSPAAAADPGQFPIQEHRVAPIPAIRDDEYDGTVAHDAPRPVRVEGAERFADAGSASPILNLARHACVLCWRCVPIWTMRRVMPAASET